MSTNFHTPLPGSISSTAEINTRLSDLDSALTAEEAARIAADSAEASTRAAAVSGEQLARAAADDAEALARIAADNTLQANINSEAAARSAGDTTLQTNITAEASARAAADTTLQTNITAEASTRATADTTLQTNITAEAAARLAADGTLQTGIDAESAARLAADAALQSAINTEAATRAAADSVLQANITAEASVRTAADAALQRLYDHLRIYAMQTNGVVQSRITRNVVAAQASTINGNGTLVTVTTDSAHGLTTGDKLVHEGTDNYDGDGMVTITVTAINQYTYPDPAETNRPTDTSGIARVRGIYVEDATRFALGQRVRLPNDAGDLFKSTIIELDVLNHIVYLAAPVPQAWKLADGQAATAQDHWLSVPDVEVDFAAGDYPHLPARLDGLENGELSVAGATPHGGTFEPTLFNIVRSLSRGYVTPRIRGATGDGVLRTAADEGYDLPGIQSHFPHAVSTSDSIDWLAYQDAMNVSRATGAGVEGDGPDAVYMLPRSLWIGRPNGPGAKGVREWDTRGSLIISSAEGQPAVDRTGMHRSEIWNLNVLGDPAAMPSVGLLLGRRSGESATGEEATISGGGQLVLHNPNIEGSFQLFALLSVNSEVVRVWNGFIRNDWGVGAYANLRYNYLGFLGAEYAAAWPSGITSPNVALWPSNASNTLHTFYETTFYYMRTTDVPENASILHFAGSHLVTINGGFQTLAKGMPNADHITFWHMAGAGRQPKEIAIRDVFHHIAYRSAVRFRGEGGGPSVHSSIKIEGGRYGSPSQADVWAQPGSTIRDIHAEAATIDFSGAATDVLGNSRLVIPRYVSSARLTRDVALGQTNIYFNRQDGWPVGNTVLITRSNGTTFTTTIAVAPVYQEGNDDYLMVLADATPEAFAADTPIRQPSRVQIGRKWEADIDAPNASTVTVDPAQGKGMIYYSDTGERIQHGNLTVKGTLDSTLGRSVALDWFPVGNITAGLATTVASTAPGGPTTAANGRVMLRAGSIVGLAVRMRANVTAGSITVRVTGGSSAVSVQVTPASPSSRNATILLAIGTSTFSAGAVLGVEYETSADYAGSAGATFTVFTVQ